jgi:putative dimethyl sulfoxide reductase chaperone
MEDLPPSERTRARAALYQVLSSAFYPPKQDMANVWEAMNRAAEEGAGMNPPDLARLKLEYNRLFVGPGKLPCPPYESVHRSDRPEMELGLVLGPSTSEVKKAYAEAGLVIGPAFRDLPDHIAVELEFMHFLCTKELESKGDGAKWHRMQKEFVRSHLKPWVGAFAAKTVAEAKSPFYRLAATLLDEFVKDETEYLDVPGGGD